MKLRILYIAAMLLFLSCACNEADNGGQTGGTGKVTVTPESIKVGNDAADVVLTVAAECDWGIYAEDKTWVSVSPSGGVAGTTDVTVSIAENRTGDLRQTSLTLRYGSYKINVPVVQNYEIHEVEISDPGFKACLLEAYDVDEDGILSTKEAEVITRIEAAGRGIKDMSGLGELFPGLTYLDCSGNKLTGLDLSGIMKLEYLDCSGNELSNLDIMHLVGLKTFDATDNPSLKEIFVWTGFKPGDSFKKPETAQWVYPDIPTPAGYKLVWQDEFNETAAGLPNTADWWYEKGAGGWGNNELQDYVAGTYNGHKIAEVAGGILTITAQKIDGKVRSVRMNTTKSWTYGYFEARLKLPKGKGTWPAFWMMPKNFTGWPKDGEIDIMEHVGYHQDFVSSSIHCTAYVHSNGTQKTKERYLKGATDEFHVYALEWTPEYIKSYVDGEQLFYYKPEDYGKRNYDTWPFDNPFYLKLNLAWGGNWGGAQGIDETCLPATYEIDYVRVFQK